MDNEKIILPGRRAWKKQDVKQRIYEAAMELFQEKGYVSTTVQEIAEQAGVSRATMFNYFPTKEAFLSQYGKNQMERVRHLISKLLSSKIDTRSKVYGAMEAAAKEVHKNRRFAYVTLTEVYKSEWAYAQEAQNRMYLVKFYEELINQGKVNGEIKPQVDSADTAEVMTGIYFHNVFQAVLQDTTQDLPDALKRSLDIIWGGIGL